MATPALNILTPDGYAAVRSAVDISVDANLVPDAVLESAAFGPAAEAEVLAREAEVLHSAIDPVKQAAHREQAVIFLTAARLAQALPFVVEQTLGDSSYRRNGFDPKKRHASLRTLAERELTAYLSGTGHVVPWTNFWLARGRRGQ